MSIFIWLLFVVAAIVFLTVRWNVHPFIALLFGAIVIGFPAGLGVTDLVGSIAEGFGSTLRSIGIVIAAGAIIGEFLDRSGGARVLANRILEKVGDHNAPLSMSMTGYIVSIPVFCDSGFIVLSALNKAISKRTGLSLTVLAVALASGLYATHVFVPPTPGPLAAAATLGADIGWVIILGLAVSIPAMIAALAWATLYCRKYDIRYDFNAAKTQYDLIDKKSNDVVERKVGSPETHISEESTEQGSRAETSKTYEIPSFKIAIAPILLPLILIALKSVAEYPTAPFGNELIFSSAVFMGDPIIALLTGVLLSFLMISGRSMKQSSVWMEEALKKAGVVILITGAGGAFGMVLRQTELATFAGQFAEMAGLGVLLPFLIAAFLKTAQGSSTVAIITAAAITAPLIEPLGFDSTVGKALLVLAIGAGSLTVSHVNDSYFWVVAKFSEMDTSTALKTHTVATLIMGITGLITIQVMSWLLL